MVRLGVTVALFAALTLPLLGCSDSGSSQQVKVYGVSPSGGPEAGGTSVSITGDGFLAGVEKILFGNNEATNIQVISDTTVQCVSPPGTGTVNVTVVSLDIGQATRTNAFTYIVALQAARVVTPEVLATARGVGDAASLALVVGLGCQGDDVASTRVWFGDREVRNVRVVNDHAILCTIPADLAGGVVDVTVQNGNGGDSARCLLTSPDGRGPLRDGGLCGGTLTTARDSDRILVSFDCIDRAGLTLEALGDMPADRLQSLFAVPDDSDGR